MRSVCVWWQLCWMLVASSTWADSPGRNGNRTIAAPNVVINQSTYLSAAATAGATTITVNSIAALNSPEAVGGGILTAGDVILIYEARGASIDASNTSAYGSVTAYGAAGHYEFRTVRTVAGNDIGLDSTNGSGVCSLGLQRAYPLRAQVIRVPQYRSFTINLGASVIASPWDGTTGGVVALLVENAATINGVLSASARGFRGGRLDASDRNAGGLETIAFASNANPAGGQKGEGIASGVGGNFGGVALSYSNPGGNFEIGAPANAGGGGGSHNAGGGGGSNGGNLSPYCTAGTSNYSVSVPTLITWCGQGVMPAGVVGAAAWLLDPGAIANGNVPTDMGGGGRGGYSYAANNADALVSGPGQLLWGGDNRRALGGWGGRALPRNLSQRVFFGGGGGAGANNNATGGAGGVGGGVVFLLSGTLLGTGLIEANGGPGASTSGGGNDAPGGGGGGGTLFITAAMANGVTLQANGGNGGVQSIGVVESEGPGGGGGGGVIALTGGALVANLNGGVGGTSNSPSVMEFPRNGATNGAAGTLLPAPILNSSINTCTDLSLTKSNGFTSMVAGQTTTYVITVINSGPSAAHGAVLRDPSVSGLSCTAIACASALSGAVCPPAASTTVAQIQGTGIVLPSLPANSSVSFNLTCNVTATGQ